MGRVRMITSHPAVAVPVVVLVGLSLLSVGLVLSTSDTGPPPKNLIDDVRTAAYSCGFLAGEYRVMHMNPSIYPFAQALALSPYCQDTRDVAERNGFIPKE